jgi:hypothetical protein
MKTLHSTLERWRSGWEAGDAAVVSAVVLASVALTFLGL